MLDGKDSEKGIGLCHRKIIFLIIKTDSLPLRVLFDGEITKSVCPSLASADEIKIIGALSMIL